MKSIIIATHVGGTALGLVTVAHIPVLQPTLAASVGHHTVTSSRCRAVAPTLGSSSLIEARAARARALALTLATAAAPTITAVRPRS